VTSVIVILVDLDMIVMSIFNDGFNSNPIMYSIIRLVNNDRLLDQWFSTLESRPPTKDDYKNFGGPP